MNSQAPGVCFCMFILSSFESLANFCAMDGPYVT